MSASTPWILDDGEGQTVSVGKSLDDAAMDEAWAAKNGREDWGHEPTAKGLFEDGFKAALAYIDAARAASTATATDAGPVAEVIRYGDDSMFKLNWFRSPGPNGTKLYARAAAPQGLTDEQIEQIMQLVGQYGDYRWAYCIGCRGYDAKKAVETLDRIRALLREAGSGK